MYKEGRTKPEVRSTNELFDNLMSFQFLGRIRTSDLRPRPSFRKTFTFPLDFAGTIFRSPRTK